MISRTKSALALLVMLSIAAVAAAQGKATGYLKVKANPGRAGVFVDGKYLGPAANFRVARKYAVPAGEYELSLRDPRHQEYTTKVTIQTGKTTVVSYALQPTPLEKPPFGRLKTSGGSKYDAVYVNSKFMGHMDEFDGPREVLLLNPGEYDVEIVPAAGGQAHAEKVKIEADRTTVVRLK